MWTTEQALLWEAMELGPYWMVRDGRSLWPARLENFSFDEPKNTPTPKVTQVRQAPRRAEPTQRVAEKTSAPRVLRPREPKPRRVVRVRVTPPKNNPKPWTADDITRLGKADWMALTRLVQECRHCPLGFERKEAFAGQGMIHPQVVIVDLMPTTQDEMQGALLSGHEGKLWRNIWHILGWSEKNDIVYLPLVKCRPYQGRRLRWERTQACQKYLLRQLRILAPKVVIALGCEAAGAILQEATPQPLANYRGQVRSVTIGQTVVDVVVTQNLKWILGHPTRKKRLWQDLVLVKRLLAQKGWSPILRPNWS